MRKIIYIIMAYAINSFSSDIDSINVNVLNFFSAKNADGNDSVLGVAIKNLEEESRNYYESCQDNGSWSDMDYYEIPSDPWDITTHYARIKAMSQAYNIDMQALFNNTEMLETIEKALDYIHNFVYDSCDRIGNLWYWRIGIPYILGPILLLMENKINSEVFNDGISTLGYLIGSNPQGAGQNLVWECLNHLYYALLTNESPRLDTVKTKMISVSLFSESEKGIMPDYSFHQHGPQLYNGAYGATFAYDVGKYFLFARGTQYELPATNFDIYVNYAAEGIRWCLYHNYFDPSVSGRAITIQNAAAVYPVRGLNSMVILANIPNTRQNDFIASAKQMLESWTDSISVEIAGMFSCLNESQIEPSWPSGHKHYHYSDYTIHRRANYYMSVKMLSDRIISSEIVKRPGGKDEGKKSWHLSDGMTYLVNKGDEYFIDNAWPTLDWERLPGTTVERKKRIIGEGYGYGSKSFVGGAYTKDYGVSAMDFAAIDSDLTAKKSWFFFDNEVVCLGSSISCTSSNVVETIINQWPLSDGNIPLFINGKNVQTELGFERKLSKVKWAQCDGIGYYFPQAQEIMCEKKIKFGKWLEIGKGDDVVYSNPILTLWYDHGTNVSNGIYAYALLPGKSKSEMEDYTASDPITVIANTDSVHAVKDNRMNITGMVFWKEGSIDIIDVDKPCVVCYQFLEDTFYIGASYPPHNLQNFNITVNKSLRGIYIPTNVSYTATDSNITITYNAQYGQNYIAKFVNDDSTEKKYEPQREHFFSYLVYHKYLNSTLNINYSLTSLQHVKLIIYNSQGQQVGVIVDDLQAKGKYSVTWEARSLNSGNYLLTLNTGSSCFTRRLLLLK